MTTFVLANNFSTTLAAAVAVSDTSITVTSTTNLPASITSGDYFPITLKDQATGLIYEIMYGTAISGSTITVTRAQEGTTAQAWSIGDYVYCGPTAGTLTNGFANLNGSASQIFQAANGVSGNDVVNFSQLSALFSTVNVVTSSRALGTTYTNSTGKPMIVMMGVTYTSGGHLQGYVAGDLGPEDAFYSASGPGGLVLMVPAGDTYEITGTSANLDSWLEVY